MAVKITASSRFIKFLAVGAFGAACYLIGSYALTTIGIEAWISSLVVYLCLTPTIYLIQKTFVFKSDISHIESFPRYVAIQLIGICLSAIIPFAFEALGIAPIASFVSVAVIIALTNYILQLNWAFSARRKIEKRIEAD